MFIPINVNVMLTKKKKKKQKTIQVYNYSTRHENVRMTAAPCVDFS